MKKLLIHIAIWIIYLIYESSILFYVQPESISIGDILLAFLLNASVFYLNSEVLLIRFGTRRKLIIYLFSLVMLVVGYLFLSYAQVRYIFPAIDGRPAHATFNNFFIAQHIYRATYFIALSFGYWFAQKNIRAQILLRHAQDSQYKQILEQEQLKKDIAVSQLAIYRAQLNPHFLFNTLNFFYSNIYPISPKLAESMVQLSNLIRYIAERSSLESLVPLKKEIEFIGNYLQLNQLRFENQLKINFEIIGIIEHKYVPPFIMMTIVENAFKYGDLQNQDAPVIISIKVKADTLHFYTENVIDKNKITSSTGIGLSNLRNQLDLIFNDRYTLETNSDGRKFKCYLKMSV